MHTAPCDLRKTAACIDPCVTGPAAPGRPDSRRLPWAAVLVALILPVTAAAQVVELNPVPVSGTIRVGDLVIDSLEVRLTSPVGSSRTTVTVPPGTVEATYSTIVQVPAGGIAFYSIGVDMRLRTSDGSQFFTFRADRPGVVGVRDGEPATLDLVLDPPSLLRFTVTALPGELLESLDLFGSVSDPFGSYFTSIDAPPGGVQSLTAEMPVLPGIEMRCFGAATMTNGRRAALEPFQLVTVPAGGVGACEFTPAEPLPTGSLGGAIDYAGAVPVEQYVLRASRRDGGSPPPLTLLPPFLPGPANRAEYEFIDILAGNYTVSALVELEGGQQNLLFTLDDNVDVGDGIRTTIVSTPICQAAVESSFAFGGISAPQDWEFRPDPVGVTRLGDLLAFSRPLADPRDGPVRMLATEGTWLQQISFSIRRDGFEPGGFTNTRTELDFLPSIVIGCGETVTTPERVLETGRVEVQFRVAGGGFLQSPRIEASCSHDDPGGAAGSYEYELSATSATSVSVPVGIVPLEAPAGVCELTGSARVGGVDVSFGALNDVEIFPGVTVVIGFGSPRIEITSPAPGAAVDAEEILVSGTATDDGGVVSVAVNGVPATLTPTGNPVDPNEVAFTAIVPLESGDNVIAALAIDADGNQSEASLRIENRRPPPPNDPPSVVITSPAPGAVIEGPLEIRGIRLLVEGIASDDAGLASVRVNGVPAVLTPTGNPNEVAFSATVFLGPGVQQVSAVAEDDRGAESTAQIEVEMVLPSVVCDTNRDFVVDRADIAQIFAARGQAATGPDDPRDANGDGLITINDGRLCVLQCTNPGCEPNPDEE